MLRKIAEIKVPTGAGAREARTEPVFASYDRQGAAFAFYFSDSNIARATANLLFMVDGQKVFVDDGVTLSETNETHTFTYPLPDELLNYTGKIDGYLYFDFEDGSHSDEIHFVFTIKKSKIDEEMEDAPDVYIKSFEDIKAEVQEAADGAKETISKKVTEVSDTSDSAISKVNQVADDTIKNVTTLTGKVTQNTSDIKQNAKDITSKVSSSDVQGMLDDGGYATQSWTGSQIKQSADEINSTVTSVSDKVNNLQIDGRNLLAGTSDTWDSGTNSGWGIFSEAEANITEPGMYTANVYLKPDKKSVNILISVTNSDGTHNNYFGSKVAGGSEGYSTLTLQVAEGQTLKSVWITFNNLQNDATSVSWKKMKLEKGKATPWAPAPEDVVTKSEIEQIKQAIINLGGEI